LSRAGPPLAAACALLLVVAPARANPSMDTDFNSMTQWLSDQLAQGLAFNAGENFDPPTLVKGYYLQPDVSFGAGIVPLSKTNFPATPALSGIGYDGSSFFPNSVTFPNLAIHLRMGLPGSNDLYVRFADATTPPGYKISPTMTAQVQTNSFGGGVRHHFIGEDGWPTLVWGLHYNYVTGRVNLSGSESASFTTTYGDSGSLTGTIAWALHSLGTDAIVYKTYGRWTPYGGLGYNYATGSVRASLDLNFNDFLADNISGQASSKPEANQGRAIAGVQYAFTNWAVFGAGEIKTVGVQPFQNYIAQIGAALPFELGCGPTFFCRKKKPGASAPEPRADERDESWPASASAPEETPSPAPSAPARRAAPANTTQPGMIFWQ
jgi:hypothetical protein